MVDQRALEDGADVGGRLQVAALVQVGLFQAGPVGQHLTAGNLRRIVEGAQAAGSRVVLAGMKLPPNYGPEYVESFEEVFPALARELDVEWVPFLLEGVAGRRSLNLPDGIHPNAEGHREIAETVLPAIRAAIATIEDG